MDSFAEFCTERFGEAPPDDMAQRLAQGRQWQDTDDIWRRRYILFKQNVVTEYNRDLIEYTQQRGLQFGLQILATAHYSSGWCWGMDSVEMAHSATPAITPIAACSPAVVIMLAASTRGWRRVCSRR